MGSWNNTCGLTNLPIISGEDDLFSNVGIYLGKDKVYEE